ncbi:MAG: hypothetical protein NZL83_04040 [Candidatus Absconditabacterales bacterium]|nr:hypothetical protein [Candidatus Absconditabacterales bacterium]
MMLLTQSMRDEVALLACTVDIISSSRVQAWIDAIGSLFGSKRSLYHCLVGDCVSIRLGGSRWIMNMHRRVR